uniref:Uncharacterized protein n=1 Tax=Panagrolaimus superbus TaxID=310955 RepID=A0A914YXG0_9BILA
MYARYQDNNIIKQDEGIYEQYFGWSFYTSIIANGFLFFASVVGCISTSIVMSSGKAKLVKIEVEDNDSLQLLGSGSSSQPFKRSYSAVYKIDSVALRKWEKEAMKGFKKNNFKRANSMPNIKKGQQHRPFQTPSYMHSNSDISKAFTDPAHFNTGAMQRESMALSETHLAEHYTGILPTGGSAFPANASDPVYPPPLPPNNPDDVVYEYVEHNSISLSSTLGKNQHPSPVKDGTSLNYYDKVASSSPSISSHQKIHTIEDNEYLRPKNPKSTTIPAYSEPSKERYLYEKNLYEKSTNDKTTTSFGSKHRRNPSEDFTRHPELLQQQNPTKLTLITPISSFPSKSKPPELPAKPRFLKSADNQSISSKASSRDSEKILLNTFDDKRSISNNRSLTSLHSVIPEKPISVFDRSETCTPTSPTSSHDSYASTSSTSRPLPSKLLHTVLRNEAANNLGMKETSLDWPKLPSSRNSRDGSIVSNNSFNGSLITGRSYAPSEMDRSVGASTIIAPNSPSQKFFDFDSDSERSMTPKSAPNSGETFV